MSDLILVIEASTRHASVALIAAGAVVMDASVTSHDPATGARVEGLMPAIATCFERTQSNPTQLSSVMCSAGPGSFTSLRSAAALAKGFCSVLRIPLYAVPTMELLVATAKLPTGLYTTALDAGRGEYYVSNVATLDGYITDITPVSIIPGTRLHTQAHERHATLVGPGLDIDIFPRASAALALLPGIVATGPAPIDTWEPRYGRLAEAQVKWEALHGRVLVP
jgi:tRNA threonylcarbamoyladenosine biosynthesis protein TsaB